MSYTKNVTIWCEGKDCDRWVYGFSRLVKQTRRNVAAEGWTFRDGKDYCPACSSGKVVCKGCGGVISKVIAIKDGSFSFCSVACWNEWNK
jgi:hypothetical protein